MGLAQLEIIMIHPFGMPDNIMYSAMSAVSCFYGCYDLDVSQRYADSSFAGLPSQ